MRSPAETEAIREEMNAISFFHHIDLGDGLITPGSLPDPDPRDSYLGIPEDLTSLSVLDIGARDGKYSFEAEKRGARFVLALDCVHSPGLEFARRTLGSQVRYAIGDIERESCAARLDEDRLTPRFDLVLFLGVLYHLKSGPMLALANIHRILKPGALLIIETAHANSHIPDPILEFIEYDYDGDPTNWWLPNTACVEAMLRATGFTRIRYAGGISNRACWHARKPL